MGKSQKRRLQAASGRFRKTNFKLYFRACRSIDFLVDLYKSWQK